MKERKFEKMKINSLTWIVYAVNGFNIETRWPIIKHGPEGSHFGYSVDGYKWETGNQWSIIVGAPTYSETDLK